MFYMGHQSALKGHLTVLENLSLDLSGWSAPSRELILNVLSQLDLKYFIDSFVNTLSIGQQRKVGLARIFLTEHPLWLLDEPFTSLDKSAISKIEDFIQNHLLSGGAIVMTSHHDISLSSAKMKVVELGARE
jgi:heme exporter protein A